VQGQTNYKIKSKGTNTEKVEEKKKWETPKMTTLGAAVLVTTGATTGAGLAAAAGFGAATAAVVAGFGAAAVVVAVGALVGGKLLGVAAGDDADAGVEACRSNKTKITIK
jgi:hypothetical protein